MSDKKYVIISSEEVKTVNFDAVFENSEDTLRYNAAGDKTFVKFVGDTPSFLVGKTQYTHTEMLSILSGPEWAPEEPVEA